MLRLRSPALARSKLSLLRAAVGEPCTCTLGRGAGGPGSARRAAVASTTQKRWLSQSRRCAGWKDLPIGRGDDDASRELESSLAQMHEAQDATFGVDDALADASSGPDSIQNAAEVVKDVLETQSIPVESLQGEKKPSKRKKRSPKAAEAEANDTERGDEKKADAKKGAKPAEKAPPKEAAKGGNKKAASPKQPAAKGSGPAKKKKVEEDLEVHTVAAPNLKLKAVPQPPLDVPKLSYDLDRCLFKPGVYPMQDARSRVFNFDPYLATVMPTHEFDFTALKSFVSSSEDESLIAHAAENNRKYSGSTSSMSSMLSHFHYLLSAWRPINPAHTSRSFVPESTNFTALSQAPAATFLRWKNGIYAVDSDKQFDTANILSMLGRSMEKLLTLPKEEYEMYRRERSSELTEEQKNSDNAFHYTMMGDFILRSQLDAKDPRLPGEGIFDIKTRAVLSIRMDAKDYQKGLGYEIRQKYGQFESFEREYFDMIRSAFLKYSLQVRMGRMDGVFVAYHNTQRIFGFQYIPLEEMDQALHGTSASRDLGDQEFKLSLHLLNQLLNRATDKYPKQPLRIHVETRPTNPPLLYFFAKPVTEEKIVQAQNKPRAEIEKFEKEMMGFVERQEAAEEEEVEEVSEGAEEDAKESDGLSLAVWTEMNQMAEEAVKSDELGIGYVRRNIEEALRQSGLLEGKMEIEVQAYVETLLETLMDGEADAPADESGVAEGHQAEEVDESEKEQARQSLSRDGAETAEEVEGTSEGSTGEEAEASSLKDLILRLAEQVDERPRAAADDNPTKLQQFQRILSELMAESRDEQYGAERMSEAASAYNTPSPETSSAREDDPTTAPPGNGVYDDVEDDNGELLGMILTVRNKVDGRYVTRPTFSAPGHRWSVEYSIQTMGKERAAKLYSQVKARRSKVFDNAVDRDKVWHEIFQRALPKLSERGSKFRSREEAEGRKKPVWIVGKDKAMKWEDVFGKKK